MLWSNDKVSLPDFINTYILYIYIYPSPRLCLSIYAYDNKQLCPAQLSMTKVKLGWISEWNKIYIWFCRINIDVSFTINCESDVLCCKNAMQICVALFYRIFCMIKKPQPWRTRSPKRLQVSVISSLKTLETGFGSWCKPQWQSGERWELIRMDKIKTNWRTQN